MGQRNYDANSLVFGTMIVDV